MKLNYLNKFLNKTVDYKKTVDCFYMSKGIACICCNVKSIKDIINQHSVEGYETLDFSLAKYIDYSIENIPVDKPVVIEFCGHKFTKKEQETIKNAVWNHYEIELGKAQKRRWALLLRIIWFVLFFIVTTILIFSGNTNEVSKELIYIVFYFLGDRVIDYLVFKNSEVKYVRIRYAQLVSMKVIFREKFIDGELTDEEVKDILDEINKNTKSTEI